MLLHFKLHQERSALNELKKFFLLPPLRALCCPVVIFTDLPIISSPPFVVFLSPSAYFIYERQIDVVCQKFLTLCEGKEAAAEGD
jgi:hypothetical protein